MGCSSVYCEYVLLSLVNKEAALAYGRAEYSKAGIPSRDRGEKKMESDKPHVAAKGERCQNLIGKSQFCGAIQINRNGLI